MSRLILVLFFSLSIFSQEISEECGTTYDQNFYILKTQKIDDFNFFLNQYYQKRQQKSSSAVTDIPIRVNILQTTGGNTAAPTFSKIVKKISPIITKDNYSRN